MSLNHNFDQFNKKVSSFIETVGFICLFLMMAITCVDVFGAKVFKQPVLGALDIVMVSQAMAVAFALGSSLILGRHVEVEFFMPLLPRPAQVVIDTLVQILCLLLFVAICWQMTLYGYDMQQGKEVTPTIRVPLYGFAYLIALSCVPVCLIYVQRIIQIMMGNKKR